MKRVFFFMLVAVCILGAQTLPAAGTNSPHSAARLEDLEGKPYPLDQVVQLLQVSINTIPFFLARYMDTGDLLRVQQIREALDESGAYVTAMEKRIRNDFQKAIFAKVLAGYQKFKDNLGRNLKAVGEFRRLARAFDHHSDQLIDWMSTDLEASFQCGAANQGPEVLRAFRDARLAVVRAAFFSRVTACRAVDETRRNKAKEAWGNASKQVAVLVGAAATPSDKETALRLASAVNGCKAIAEEMAVQADELNQTWEQTQSMAESLETLINPLHSAQTKKEGPK